MRRLRERVALRLAPWLYVPYREDREEAFRDLAKKAYDDRAAIWTNPRTLVRHALKVEGIREFRRGYAAGQRNLRAAQRAVADRGEQ